MEEEVGVRIANSMGLVISGIQQCLTTPLVVTKCPTRAAGLAWTSAGPWMNICSNALNRALISCASALYLSINTGFPQLVLKQKTKQKALKNPTTDLVCLSTWACAGKSPCQPEQGPSTLASHSSHSHFNLWHLTFPFKGPLSLLPAEK